MTQQAIWHMIREENPNIYHLAKLPFDELKIRSPITRNDIDRYEEWNRNSVE